VNKIKLIQIYYYICESYDKVLSHHCQRFSNNSTEPCFTDQELLTIYLYVMLEEEKFKIKSIHKHAKNYLLSWFPDLPSYAAFNSRLNRMSSVFPILLAESIGLLQTNGVNFRVSLVDSFPIITCSGKRTGKVATQITNKGYCASKKLHYYGVKLHCIAFKREGKLPIPEYISISQASEHDLTALRYLFEQIHHRDIYADKAYCDAELKNDLKTNNHLILNTPIKNVKGEPEITRSSLTAFRQVIATAVAKVRQPIESLFNWFIQKTDIQRASKVRSLNGLLVHVFGRLNAAIFNWLF